MRRWRRVVACAPLMLLGAAPWARSANAPSAADLAHCAGIAAPESRLACYDVLAGRPAERAGTGAGNAGAGTAAAIGGGSAAASPPAPAPLAADDPRNFGLNQAQLHQALGPQAIHAVVDKITQDRLGRTSVVLDNGQTWSYTDEDGRLSAGNTVIIKRAALGSFLMSTPSRRVYTVHRIH